MSFQATVHLLRLQGFKLNDRAVPPEATYQCRPGYTSYLPESDPEWKTYRCFCCNTYQDQGTLNIIIIRRMIIAKAISP